MKITQSLVVLLVVPLLGCASEVKREQARLSLSTTQETKSLQIVENATVQLSTGYARTIKAGSTWKRAGFLGTREVYSAVNDVFTIEGAHVHEAYLVLDGNTLIGFYLPGDQAVSWLQHKVTLRIKQTEP